MSRNSKRILLFAGLLVLLGAAIGYYYYNKGPLDIKDSKSVKATAIELYTLYDSDSNAAQIKYSGKVVEVTGQVHEITVNQKNEKVILLGTGYEGGFINCTMEENAGNINQNEIINVKGLCSGIGQGDPDLGLKGDVYLTRCFLIK